MNADAVRLYVAEHGTPPEPTFGSVMDPAQFPGADFESGTVIDGDALNEYAELVGWRCRFVEAMPGHWMIGYPATPEELEAMRAQTRETERLRDAWYERDRTMAAEVRRFTAREIADAFELELDALGPLPDEPMSADDELDVIRSTRPTRPPWEHGR